MAKLPSPPTTLSVFTMSYYIVPQLTLPFFLHQHFRGHARSTSNLNTIGPTAGVDIVIDYNFLPAGPKLIS
jgi:hypothetical protein